MSAIKVTIIGAGSVVFSLGMVKDLCLTKSLAGSKISFVDIHEGRLDVIYQLAIRYAQDLGADLSFEKTLDRRQALQDTDFMINTATVTHNEYWMKRQRELAAQYGYFFGRTGLPEYHNLQLMLECALDVAKICPHAWILQAGNPVFEGTTLMSREAGVKVCGLCHGHYGYRNIARTIGLDPERVTWQAPGLNHNIWLTHFYYDDQDAYPLLDAWIEKEAPAYWREKEAAGGIPAQMSPAAVHQYQMYGLMPVGDTPRSGGWWYHTDLDTRMRWYGGPIGGGDTPAGRNRILEEKEKHFQEMQAAAYDPQVRPITMFGDKKTSEQHIPIIDALVNNNPFVAQVNVPNRGALAGLPDDVAVEVPAVVDKRGIQPLRVDPLPPKVMLECIYPDWLDMERTLQALKSGDKSMLLYGILGTHQTSSYERAVELLDALLAMEPNEPMAYLEDINDHYHWPDNWHLPITISK